MGVLIVSDFSVIENTYKEVFVNDGCKFGAEGKLVTSFVVGLNRESILTDEGGA